MIEQKKHTYSLRKSKKIFRNIHNMYLKKKKKLSSTNQQKIEELLTSCHFALTNKDKEQASIYAHSLEKLHQTVLYKKPWEKFIEVVGALVVALVLALVIRQMWFELYMIPTGSMRPTLKEGDFILVSKTDYSINTLGKTGHLYFDPKLVNRGGIVVFSVANMDVRDSNTTYFLIIPGKKQFVKRLIAKPGDTIYFYGGKLYGIDEKGQEITDYYKNPWFDQIEHIPIIRFNGNVVCPQLSYSQIFSPVYLYQMGIPIAKMFLNAAGKIQGELLPIKNANEKLSQPQKEYFDLWGIKNFAMTRIISKKEALLWYPQHYFSSESSSYYLELTHHPNLKNDLPLKQDALGRMRPHLNTCKSLLALNNNHLRKIFANLYTARFRVKNNKLYRANLISANTNNSFAPSLNKRVPDGTYEFYHGKAYKIYPGWIAKQLPNKHPLYEFSAERAVLFYNLGIECDTRFAPKEKDQSLIPSRYGYFKDNSLYLLNTPILTKDDPFLISFINKEIQKKEIIKNYFSFIPSASPLKPDGTLDIQFIKNHGLKIPDHQYLVLGDNHAMSADSRDFGFVPEKNLRGGPSFIFWPPSKRFGPPMQPTYVMLSLPKIVIWGAATAVIIILIIFYRIRKKNLLKF